MSNLYKNNDHAQRQYEAALIASNFSSPLPNTEAENLLRRVRNGSREAAKNNYVMRKYLKTMVDSTIGSGIQLESRLMMQTRGLDRTLEPNTRLNEQIEDAWHDWSERCDVRGQLNLLEMQRFVVHSLARDGEALIHHGITPDRELVLELLEPELLDVNYSTPEARDGTLFVLGVQIDAVGRPIGYAILGHNPEDLRQIRKNVPYHLFISADQMLHLYEKEYSDQLRGFPWASASLILMNHLKEYEHNLLVKARIHASITYFLKSMSPELSSKYGRSQVVDEDKNYKRKVITSEPGSVQELPPGTEIDTPSLNGTDLNHEVYLRQTMQLAASGVGLSYESLSGDYSKSNFSSSRLARLQEQNTFRTVQQMVVDKFLRPIFNQWIQNEVQTGRIRLSRNQLQQLISSRRAARWILPGFVSVDPEKTTRADILALDAGLKSRTEILASEGKDFTNLVKQIQQERDLLYEAGLDELAEPNPTNDTPAEDAAATEEEETEETPVEEEDEDAVSQE